MYPLSICSHLSYAVVYAQSKKGALGCVCARACVDRVYTICILFWGLFWILLILLGVVKFYSSTTFCSSHGRHTCVADKEILLILLILSAPSQQHKHTVAFRHRSLAICCRCHPLASPSSSRRASRATSRALCFESGRLGSY